MVNVDDALEDFSIAQAPPVRYTQKGLRHRSFSSFPIQLLNYLTI